MSPETISDDMLVSYLLGESAVYERLLVEQWLDASPANRARLDALETIWTNAALPQSVPVDWDVEKAWAKVSQRIDRAELLKNKQRRLTRSLLWFAIPAAAVLAVVFFFRVVSSRSEEKIYLRAGVERLTDTLPDGSLVMLAPGSQLWYTPDEYKTVRDIGLSGEAYLAVARDSAHPFTVKTVVGSAKVLGTRFIVRTHGDTSLYVSVEEGLVALASNRQHGAFQAVRLGAGEAALVTRNRTEPRPAPVATPEEFFSYTGIVTFRDEPLTAVTATLLRTHGIILRFSSSGIGGLRLTATFSNQSPDEIAAVVAATLGLAFEPQGNRTYVLKHDEGE